MIERIKVHIWDGIKTMDVSLAMIFNNDQSCKRKNHRRGRITGTSHNIEMICDQVSKYAIIDKEFMEDVTYKG